MKTFGFFYHQNRDPWQGAPDWALELGIMLGISISNTENIMAAIDTLKDDIAALLAEATQDINAAVAQAKASSNDPAIQQLASAVEQATKKMHDDFQATTGTPVPATPTP